MPNRSFALAVKLSSWRLGVRISSWLECRVTTAIGRSVVCGALRAQAAEPGSRGRGWGCPRTSRARRSRGSGTLEALGHLAAPLLADLLPDDVAVEQRRRARAAARARRRRSVLGGGTHSTMSANGEVGEELPVPHEQVEPLHVCFRGTALREDEVTEGRHPASLGPPPCGERRPLHRADRFVFRMSHAPYARSNDGRGRGGRAGTPHRSPDDDGVPTATADRRTAAGACRGHRSPGPGDDRTSARALRRRGAHRRAGGRQHRPVDQRRRPSAPAAAGSGGRARPGHRSGLAGARCSGSERAGLPPPTGSPRRRSSWHTRSHARAVAMRLGERHGSGGRPRWGPVAG